MKKVEEEEARRESTAEPSQFDKAVHAQYNTSSMAYTHKSGKSRKVGIKISIYFIFYAWIVI